MPRVLVASCSLGLLTGIWDVSKESLGADAPPGAVDPPADLGSSGFPGREVLAFPPALLSPQQRC